MNKDAQKKQFLRSNTVRTCRKCGTTFQQALYKKECPFCGASDNRREVNTGKRITTKILMKRVKMDALYKAKRGMYRNGSADSRMAEQGAGVTH